MADLQNVPGERIRRIRPEAPDGPFPTTQRRWWRSQSVALPASLFLALVTVLAVAAMLPASA